MSAWRGSFGGEDRRCRHQAVEARAALEADVVAGGDVVQVAPAMWWGSVAAPPGRG